METSTTQPLPNGRLDSWKEIATYLGRGVRTVQRWEREEGLPVHRLVHEKRGSIYAYKHELDTWWQSRRSQLSVSPSADADQASVAQTNGRPLAAPVQSITRQKLWRTRWLVISGLALTAIFSAGVLWLLPPTRIPASSLERVTSTGGRTVMPVLSRDGGMIAYVSDGGRDDLHSQIWVQQIGGRTAIQLTHDAARHTLPSLSSDGTRVIFTRTDQTSRAVYEVASLGGEPRLFLPGAFAARFSPNGKWVAYVGGTPGEGLALATPDGKHVRNLAGGLLAVRPPVWSPDARYLLAGAKGDPAADAEWWIVPIDGSPPIHTGIVHLLRLKGFNEGWLLASPAWTQVDAILFSGRTEQGWSIWKQRISPDSFKALGDPERITDGTALEWYPSVAAGHLAFVSSHLDNNLWSLPTDTNTGKVLGPLRRLTRGSGLTGYASLSSDGDTVVFASDRTGNFDIYLRDMQTGNESVIVSGPDRQMYSVLSKDGRKVAYGVVMPGPKPARPIFVLDVATGASRKVCDDCNGRPREWLLDHRHLLIQTSAQRNSIAVADTETGSQRDLLVSTERSISNPATSRDGKWIAFDVTCRRTAALFIAPLGGPSPIPETRWSEIVPAGSHPFWSPNGRLLYYIASADGTSGSAMVRALHFDPSRGQANGEPVDVFSLEGMLFPELFSNATVNASENQIVLPLSDLRGEVWVMEFPK
jgi:Tol biopolymer transport system component